MALEVAVHAREAAVAQALQGQSLALDERSVALVRPGAGAQQQAAFRADVFQSRLSAQEVGRVLLAAASAPSTQTFLHRHFAALPSGTVFVADEQTSGKGRGKNTWTSPAGCLMFSVYQQLDIQGERLPFVQYVMSLAIVAAVRQLAQAVLGAQAVDLDVRIKWPNDIYAWGMKIGGILCQSVYRGGLFHLVIGAGLNVTNREPTTCVAALLEEARSGGGASHLPEELYREVLLSEIANNLEAMCATLRHEGFGPLREAYLRSWLHSDQQVVLEEKEARVPLTITGISDSGYMTAVDAEGERYELHPDGNSLDFFKGLVRHKQTTAT